ncbi:hypothetical protein QTA57_01855 [Fontisubflavum oceani]|nr:hypothetical protein [Fontisubflavum oceani]WJY21957.1 hypothetical protein QTA57_01855 [Fontisubflavum oceani]
MSVLVDENTKVISHGFTGLQGTFHSDPAIAYGSKMVGGVIPCKDGMIYLDPQVCKLVHQTGEEIGDDTPMTIMAAPGEGL